MAVFLKYNKLTLSHWNFV